MDKDIMAAIRKRDQERGTRFTDIVREDWLYGQTATAGESLALGLDFLVADYRETAELWTQAKARGGKAQSDDRKTVAAALALLAVDLRRPAAKAEHAEKASAPRPAPEKRCGKVEQHEKHAWTEWVDLPTLGEQRADVYACPGWADAPRDLSGLKALVAERAALGNVISVGPVVLHDNGDGTASNVEPITAAVAPVDVTAYEDGEGAQVLQWLSGERVFVDEPDPGMSVVDAFTMVSFGSSGPHIETDPSAPGAMVLRQTGVSASVNGVALAFDEPPPPGQEVALKGDVFTWSKLREVQRDDGAMNGDQVHGLGLPAHVSHSQISTFAECGLKGLLTRSETLGVEQLPQWANVGGTAVHLAVERFETQLALPGQERHVRDALAGTGVGRWWGKALADTMAQVAVDNPHAPVETWRASKKGVENYTWWLVEGEAMFGRYVRARLAELESPWRRVMMTRSGEGLIDTAAAVMLPMLEHEFEMDVEGVPFKGVIDQVWEVTSDWVPEEGLRRVGPGDLVIDDIKSGATPNDESQLREYAMWLASTGATRGTARIWGRFIDVRQGEIASAPFILLYDSDDAPAAQGAWDELAFKVEHTAGLKSSGSFMPRKNNYCVACPVKHACPIMAAKL